MRSAACCKALQRSCVRLSIQFVSAWLLIFFNSPSVSHRAPKTSCLSQYPPHNIRIGNTPLILNSAAHNRRPTNPRSSPPRAINMRSSILSSDGPLATNPPSHHAPRPPRAHPNHHHPPLGTNNARLPVPLLARTGRFTPRKGETTRPAGKVRTLHISPLYQPQRHFPPLSTTVRTSTLTRKKHRIHTLTPAHQPPTEFLAALKSFKAQQLVAKNALLDREALATETLQLYEEQKGIRDAATRARYLRAEMERVKEEASRLEKGGE